MGLEVKMSIPRLSAYTDEDSDGNAMLKDHAYQAVTDGLVCAVMISDQAGRHIDGFVETAIQYGIDGNPLAGGIKVQCNHCGVTADYNLDISFEVAKGEYFEVTTNDANPISIYWKSLGRLAEPIDFD